MWLYLKSLWSDHEVEDGHFDGDFGWEMGVPQVCDDVKLEGGVVLDHLIPQKDAVLIRWASLEGLTQKDRLQAGVKLFTHVLQQGGLTMLIQTKNTLK